MQEEGNIYAVIATASEYRNMSLPCLPQAVTDGEKMHTALLDVLHIPGDNIRVLGDEGTVTLQNFARALGEYRGMVGERDTLLFYFSGHGQECSLVLSDGAVNLASILQYMEKLKVGRAVFILDACYAGSLHPEHLDGQFLKTEDFDTAMRHGIAVLASSAADERSWTDPSEGSIFTSMLLLAMSERHLDRNGRLALTDLAEETRFLMDAYAEDHPDRKQTLIFRTSVETDVQFQIEHFLPYIPKIIQFESDTCYVARVKPLSTGSLKRLAVMVIPKTTYRSLADVPGLVYELLPLVRGAEVYRSEESELLHSGEKAAAVWFYFARDDDDLSMDRYYSIAVWAATPDLRRRYYRINSATKVVGDICVSENASYQLLRDMQKVTVSGEDMAECVRKWEGKFLSLSGRFQEAWQETENRQLSYPDLQSELVSWTRDVQQLFYEISDAEVPPVDLRSVYDRVAFLAGWLSDIADVLLKPDTPDTRWRIRYFVRRYRQELDVHYPHR